MGTPAGTLTKTQAVAAVAELSDGAAAFLTPELQPADFASLLLEKKLYPDAVRFLAHSLPKREGVWWAWVCAKRATPSPAPKIKTALEATEKWISQPTEEHRREAHAAAQQAEFSTAAGCAGLAAFFSGGSLGPPHAPPVPPGEHLTAKAVSGAVIFAAIGSEPEKAPEKFQNYVTQGIEVAKKIKVWEAKE
jgi:hypothetical protein